MPITSCMYNKNNGLIAMGSSNGEYQIFNTKNKQIIHKGIHYKNYIASISIIDNTQYIWFVVIGYLDKSVLMVSSIAFYNIIDANKLVEHFPLNSSEQIDVYRLFTYKFYVYALCKDGQIYVWNYLDGNLLYSFYTPDILAISVNPIV